MKNKFTFKRIVLAVILLAICVLSVTILLYDLIEYAVDYSTANEIKSIYGIQLNENGFDFIKGENSFTTGAFFELTGGSFSNMDFIKFGCLAILIIGSLSFVFYIMYLFLGKTASRIFAALIIAINLICSLLYLALGVIFRISCEQVYVTDNVFTYDGSFNTYSYIPLCLSVFALLIYTVCAIVIKKDTVTESNTGNVETVIQEEKPVRDEEKSGIITNADIQKLIKIKQLYDDGVITEKEFARQKEFIFNK